MVKELKSIRSPHLLVAILSLLGIVFLGFEFNILGDLHVYLTAPKNLFSSNIYLIRYGTPAVFYYMGNPFFSLCLYPLTFFPVQLTALLWKVLNIALLFRIWKIMEHYFPLDQLSFKNMNRWIISSFGAAAFVIYANLHIVQLTIVMLYLALEGIYQVSQRDNQWLGGFIISWAIAIKISPIVLLPYLIYRSYYKAAAIVTLLCVSFLLLPALFLGWNMNVELWTEWWSIIDSKSTVFDMNNRKNHGISTFLSTLFIADIQDNRENLLHRRHLVDLGRNVVVYLIYAARLMFVILSLYFFRSRPFVRIKNKLHQFWELSYLLLAIPMIFPQQRTYNFIFLLPAVTYLGYNFINAKEAIKGYTLKLCIFIFSIIILNLELVLGVFRKYYWHHKTLTHATLMLLLLLLIIQPFKTINTNKKLNNASSD